MKQKVGIPIMPTSFPQTLRGSIVAVAMSMVQARVRSTSAGTMAVLAVATTTRGARCLSLVMERSSLLFYDKAVKI